MLDPVDQLQIKRVLQKLLLHVLHDLDRCAIELSPGLVELRNDLGGLAVAVLGELVELVDDVGADGRPGRHDGGPGGTGAVAAKGVVDQRPDLLMPDTGNAFFEALHQLLAVLSGPARCGLARRPAGAELLSPYV
ncbi:hypothetical protein ABZS79_34195 [Streptomyces griseoloalbus]|uniref:hypothetical protein n=1 Tax=Streptomyces griseoloalbus TaxID=67303 RepID=UPI0033B723B5